MQFHAGARLNWELRASRISGLRAVVVCRWWYAPWPHHARADSGWPFWAPLLSLNLTGGARSTIPLGAALV